MRGSVAAILVIGMIAEWGSAETDAGLGPSSRRTPLVFSEVQYHPAESGDGRDLEFVEIHNSNPWPEDVSLHRLRGEMECEIPEGIVIPAWGFLLVAGSPEDLRSGPGVPEGVVVLEAGSGALGNGGGELRLEKPNGAVLLELEYDDDFPWPAAADGSGHSLVMAEPSYGEADPRAWQASAFVGGSPGLADPARDDSPLRAVRFNEVLLWPEDGAGAFIELRNHGTEVVDLTGCVIEGDGLSVPHVFAEGTVLSPGQLHVVAGLRGPSPVRPRLLLWNAGHTAVIDAFRCDGQRRGISGRPDGESLAPTPGRENPAASASPVVINEIMYHPISGQSDDEYLEIHNPGAGAIDLSGWRFSDGIDFTFPAGTLLGAGGYLVVAKNRERLVATHPGLRPEQVLGGYAGELSNRGERVALSMPESFGATDYEVVVDEVTYADGGAWGEWSDGGGSSLELIDPRSDNRMGGNWRDSDESSKGTWSVIEQEGLLDFGMGAADRIQLFLLGKGRALVDDVQVEWEGRDNLLGNGDFGAGASGWTFQGTHRTSAVVDGVLQVNAVDRGDLVANRIFRRLSPIPREGTRATIRARARWQAGFPELLVRLKGNHLEADGRLPVPENLGTPGGRNSRWLANAPPTITEVAHAPIVPAAGEDVTVTARVDDVDGVASVVLTYRIDPSTTTTAVPMTPLGDGRHGAVIPGQASRKLLAFRIAAEDAGATRATAVFPPDAPEREALILFGDGEYESERFGTYRLWMTQATAAAWAAREKMSNEPLPVTFVHGARRVIHNAGAWFSGSAYTSPGYDSPTGTICGYDVEFPSDERLLGAGQITLDFPVRDPTAQREQLMFWFADRLGLPSNYRRHVHLFVNGIGNRSRPGWGTRSNAIYEDVQQPGADLIDEFFPGNRNGHLYKGDYWHEFDDRGTRIDPAVVPAFADFTTDDGTRKIARYRWIWRPRAIRGNDASDFQPLLELIDTLNVDPDTAAWRRAVEERVDVENWLRTFVVNDLASNWDSFGNTGIKNTFHYKPEGGRWALMSWDFDVGLGVFNDPPGAALFTSAERQVRNVERDPLFVRHYWLAMHEAVQGFFQEDAVRAYTLAKFAALEAAGVPVVSPDARSGESGRSLPDWVNARRNFLLGQIDDVTGVAFSIDGLPGDVFSQVGNLLELRGSAPVPVADIAVNGRPLGVTWTDTNSWRGHLFLESGANALRIAGVDRAGAEVTGTGRELSVEVTGMVEPVAGRIVINEIMLDPPDVPEAQFVELHNRSLSTAYDLGGWSIPEIALTFARGTVIAPGGFVVAALDATVFGRLYGGDLPLAATFAVSLADGAGTLTLTRPGADGGAPIEMNRAVFLSGAPDQAAAFGGGASLQLAAPDLDNAVARHWVAVTASDTGQALIGMDSSWRYFQEGAPQEDWRDSDFDSSDWEQGGGLLGVSSALLPSPIGTPLLLGQASYYFRTEFDLPAPPVGAEFLLRTLVDDGAVIYINGTEALRLRLGDGEVTDQTFARPSVRDAEIEGPFALAPEWFRNGRNVIAAEVHQSVLNSADVVFGLELLGGSGGAPAAQMTPGAANAVGRQPGPASRLHIPDFSVAPAGDGRVSIRFTAPADLDGVYGVEVSVDLTSWRPLPDTVASGGTFEADYQALPGTRALYFRVIQTP